MRPAEQGPMGPGHGFRRVSQGIAPSPAASRRYAVSGERPLARSLASMRNVPSCSEVQPGTRRSCTDASGNWKLDTARHARDWTERLCRLRRWRVRFTQVIRVRGPYRTKNSSRHVTFSGRALPARHAPATRAPRRHGIVGSSTATAMCSTGPVDRWPRTGSQRRVPHAAMVFESTLPRALSSARTGTCASRRISSVERPCP